MTYTEFIKERREERGFYNLLSVEQDAKTIKGSKNGYLTGVLYLAPWKEGGVGNVCPHASPGCIATCLFTAGRGRFAAVKRARVKRTRWFTSNRDRFMADLVDEIQRRVVSPAIRRGMTPAVRLNGTSELPFERIPCSRYGVEHASIFAAFPSVQFYDYVKGRSRMMQYLNREMPSNYHLTFSRSETNGPACVDVIAHGGNVAVLFGADTGEADRLWLQYQLGAVATIDGDASDLRFLDDQSRRDATTRLRDWERYPNGRIVALKAKGDALKAPTGPNHFVYAMRGQ